MLQSVLEHPQENGPTFARAFKLVVPSRSAPEAGVNQAQPRLSAHRLDLIIDHDRLWGAALFRLRTVGLGSLLGCSETPAGLPNLDGRGRALHTRPPGDRVSSSHHVPVRPRLHFGLRSEPADNLFGFGDGAKNLV